MKKETKMAAAPAEGDALMRIFEEYKEANDQRLAAIEAGRADALHDEKVGRIDRALAEQKAAIDRLTLAARRPSLAAEPPVMSEHKAAWASYLRKGDESGLSRMEAKSLSVSVNADGGYVAPPELDRMIERRLAQVSPMRQIASVQTTGANMFRKPISITAAGSGWVAETGSRTQTTSPTLALLDFPTAELYANLAATQTLLDDSFVNVEEWVAAEVEDVFSAQERAAFVSGDGSSKPMGFLGYTIVADSSYAWGSVGYLPSGAAGAFAASNPADPLFDLVYALKSQYRQNARFVMNRKTVSAIRKLKDTDGRYLWQPNVTDSGASVLGFPVTEIEDMPDIAANSYSIAFADFQRAYLIVDRAGVRVLRDPYSSKPYILFYVTKRVGGGVQNFDAIKLMKFAAS